MKMSKVVIVTSIQHLYVTFVLDALNPSAPRILTSTFWMGVKTYRHGETEAVQD